MGSNDSGHRGLPPSRPATPADLPRKGGGAPSVSHLHVPSLLLHLLHIDPDGAATGEPDLPGGLVGHTEFEGLRLAALDDVQRLGYHRALHAAARDAAEKIA